MSQARSATGGRDPRVPRYVHSQDASAAGRSLSARLDGRRVAALRRIVPKHIATGILALIDRLPLADGLCHGDLHPDSVNMTAEGPRLIDWTFAVRAPALFDLGGCHISLTELALDVADDPKRPLAVNAAVQSEYARLSSISQAVLTAAMEPWLPIAAVRLFVPLGGPTSARWERIIQRVEAALRQHD